MSISAVLLLSGLCHAQAGAAAQPRPARQSELSVPPGDLQKLPQSAATSKLDPPLEAIARAWRRYGSKGVRRESRARQVPVERLRVPAIIQLTSADRTRDVLAALARAWGEVTAVNDDRIHVWLPVPAMRRISNMNAVSAIYLSRPLAPMDRQSKEKER